MAGIGKHRIVVGGLMVVALAVACGQPSARYVSNQDLGAFVKLPPDWQVFDSRDGAGRGGTPRTPQGGQSGSGQPWVAIFDADPRPDPDHLLQQFRDPSEYPTGVVRVRQLTDTERQDYSLRSLHDEFVPLAQLEREDPDIVEVLYAEEISTDDGFHGHRTVANLEVDSGRVTVDKTAMLDPTLRTVYVLAVQCSAACYANHRDAIDDVVASLTLQEPGR